MFLETKRDGETITKPDPFKLETFIAWLEKQPADKGYCYTDHGRCLHAQYFSEMLGRPIFAGMFRVGDDQGNCYALPKSFIQVALASEVTFGAALARAKALHAEGRAE